jgi:prepilin-type N-terminal cleavage/methylation domain-containing protein
MKKHIHGFTLLEMTIVLVVIALTTGGIIFARDMIRNSELRAAIDESQYYIQALNAFKDKYGQMPGDFSTATSVWPAADAVAATCKTTVTDLKKTCNGDGDGLITAQGTSSTHFEQFRAWQHLRLAGMIESEITPIAASGGTQVKTVGYNIPSSKLSGAGWGLLGLTITYVTVTDTRIINYSANDIPPNHVLILGGNSFAAYPNKPHQNFILTGLQAKAIDSKIDDGLQNTGKVVFQYDPDPMSLYPTEYLGSDSGAIYTLFFKTGL